MQVRKESRLVNSNIEVAGRRTSMRLDPDMWTALEEVCRRERMTVHDLVTRIGDTHRDEPLTNAVRAYTLAYYRSAATEPGHAAAGHGDLN